VSLGALFAKHLRQAKPRALAAALSDAGLVPERKAYEAWLGGANHVEIDGARIAIGATPPAAPMPRDRWFDVCELAMMVQAGRSWLALRPAGRWQMRGFLDVAERGPRAVQIAPPYRALDPERIASGDELARCTNLTAGEATLYAWWFGKLLPHLYDWQSALEQLPAPVLRELWIASSKEWTSMKLSEDEAARIFVTPSTIDWEPSEVADDEMELPDQRRGMIRGEYTRDPEIGFRTAVLMQTGLLENVSAWSFLAEDVRLMSLIDRGAFR